LNALAPNRARRWIWLALFLTLASVAVCAWRGVGNWLVREDPIGPADAIVVLSGRMPVRALGASDLYRQGCVPEVWLTKNPDARGELERLGIAFTGDEEYDRQVLEKTGVPTAAIRVLNPEVTNTEAEVRLISAEMERRGLRRVIIVTSAPHTRRVRAIWRALVDGQAQAIIRYSREDSFEAQHWWRSTSDVQDVVHEILGLLNVWSGFRVRPAGG